MSIYDEVFEPSNKGAKTAEKSKNSYSREEWAERRAQERTEVFDLADEMALEAVSDAKKFRTLLDVGARMISYSSTNIILIAAQMPAATNLRTFEEWKELGSYVKRGERCVKLIIPGKQYTRDDGTKGTYFDVVRVYDRSQTGEGSQSDSGKAAAASDPRVDYKMMLRCIFELSTVDFVATDSLPNNMCAFFSPENNTVLVRRGAPRDQALRELLTELAHQALAHGNDNYTREAASDSAYCASYILAAKYGLDTKHYVFDDVISRLSKSAKNSREIRSAYSEIHAIAKRIALGIDGAQRRLLKEADKEAVVKEG